MLNMFYSKKKKFFPNYGLKQYNFFEIPVYLKENR